ncbi:MAG: TadE/TadG family type IV pilus assembly protein [Actinomycetota bacterium]
MKGSLLAREGLFEAREQRGATAVEFALVAVLLFTLLFGIIEFGLVGNDFLAVRFGSQEAARQAAVGTTGSDGSCSLSGPATGAGSSTRQLLCLTKERVGLGSEDVRVNLVFGTGGYAEQSRLAVCVQTPMRSRSGLFTPLFGDRVLRSRAEARIEDLASPALQAVAETPPPGGDWSWCNID